MARVELEPLVLLLCPAPQVRNRFAHEVTDVDGFGLEGDAAVGEGLALADVVPVYAEVVQAMGARLIAPPPSLLNPQGRATDARFRSANTVDFTHLNDDGARLLFGEVIRRLGQPAAT